MDRVVEYIERRPTPERTFHKGEKFGTVVNGNNITQYYTLSFFKAIWRFPKSQRSTFSYWFAHWCAFNMLALCMGLWKPRHLLHDFEKPWLRIFLPYKKVQKLHRSWSRHHIEYKRRDKIRWIDLMIDWECSQFTKVNGALDARETIETYKGTPYYEEIKEKLLPLLAIYKL